MLFNQQLYVSPYILFLLTFYRILALKRYWLSCLIPHNIYSLRILTLLCIFRKSYSNVSIFLYFLIAFSVYYLLAVTTGLSIHYRRIMTPLLRVLPKFTFAHQQSFNLMLLICQVSEISDSDLLRTIQLCMIKLSSCVLVCSPLSLSGFHSFTVFVGKQWWRIEIGTRSTDTASWRLSSNIQ